MATTGAAPAREPGRKSILSDAELKECEALEREKRAYRKLVPAGSGRPMRPEPDVWEQTHYNIPFRLARGFAMMRRSD